MNKNVKIPKLLAVIEEISQVLLRIDEWSHVRPKVFEHCCELVDAEVCALYLKDDTGKKLYLDGGLGYQPAVKEGDISYSIGNDPNGTDAEGITGWVAQTGEYAKADSYEEVKNLPGWRGKFDQHLWGGNPGEKFRCMLAVPLKIGENEIIGVLKVENKRVREEKLTAFNDDDKKILEALATAIASATQVHRLQTAPVTRAFKVAEGLISSLHSFDFYQQLVIVCRELLDAQVCALYLIDLKNKPDVLVLVAGEGYKKIIRPGTITYSLSGSDDGSDAEGVTAWVAKTGKEIGANSFEEVKKLPGWRGKWDELQWEENPQEYFKCMLAIPLKHHEKVFGVLKIENKLTEPSEFRDTDKRTLRIIARNMSEGLYERLKVGLFEDLDDFEYRAVRFKERKIEKKAVGDVIVKHSLTSICPSDVAYFLHNKDRKKLDDRLPMALGHETTGIVQYAKGNITYPNDLNKRIQTGDRVVVIPLIPCGSCHVCKGPSENKKYGENYCPSSRFMASNAPGSLRTQYKYYPELLLKIPDELEEKFALLTEPMSNVVQALMEFGFKTNSHNDCSYEFDMIFHKEQMFSYFHVPTKSFTNIFDTITAEEPFPRTVFFLDMDGYDIAGPYDFTIYNLLRKGLSIYGGRKPEQTILSAKKPRILILGSGTIGYLFTLILSQVYKVPKESLYVTGRSDAKLDLFRSFANTYNIKNFAPGGLSNQLRQGGEFDAVFECVGWPAISENIEISLECLRPNGVLGIIGLVEGRIPINLKLLKEKQIYLKGFFRGSLDSYMESLRLISTEPRVREGLAVLLREDIYSISNEQQLEDVFNDIAQSHSIGRHVVRLT